MGRFGGRGRNLDFRPNVSKCHHLCSTRNSG
uniref:Uncharacterized protein n=1 Tax=Anguilla anguilla TaxID=7936 RepID=A0A0E9VAX5_ANGAN